MQRAILALVLGVATTVVGAPASAKEAPPSVCGGGTAGMEGEPGSSSRLLDRVQAFLTQGEARAAKFEQVRFRKKLDRESRCEGLVAVAGKNMSWVYETSPPKSYFASTEELSIVFDEEQRVRVFEDYDPSQPRHAFAMSFPLLLLPNVGEHFDVRASVKDGTGILRLCPKEGPIASIYTGDPEYDGLEVRIDPKTGAIRALAVSYPSGDRCDVIVKDWKPAPDYNFTFEPPHGWTVEKRPLH